MKTLKQHHYNHWRNAGNRGDVWKHFILMELLELILEAPGAWERPLCYLDTHCGPPLYILAPGGRWEGGIGRAFPPRASLAHRPYFRILTSLGDPRVVYPSSWLQVSLALLRRGVSFRAVLRDLSPVVEMALWGMGLGKRGDGPFEFKRGDGFSVFEEGAKWDLVLVDPPFSPEPHRDFERCEGILRKLRDQARWFIIWYPIFSCSRGFWKGMSREKAFELIWHGPEEGSSIKGCGVLAGGLEGKQVQAVSRHLRELAEALNGQLEVWGQELL